MGTVWGIDIGRRAVKGVKFRDSSAGPVLEAADSVLIELKPNATDAEKDEAMRSAVATFTKRHGIRTEPVFVSIPGHTTFNRVLRIPVVDDKKLDSTIRFEAQQQIPFPIEEVVWDYHPLPMETPGEMEISLFAVKNDFIRRFIHNLELGGLQPAGIQIAPLALFNLARFELDMRGTNIILDMGSDATDLLVIDQDKTWMRPVPIAGNDVTKALQDKFKLPFDEAEKLKIKSGSSKQAQKIFGVMKPILNDMVSEVDRSLSYYKSQVPDVEFKECLLLGSGGKLVGIRKYLREVLDVDITRITTLKKIQVGTNLNLEFLQANLSGLPVALGLALQALGKADNGVNFLPRALAQARAVKASRPWYAAAAAMLVIGVIVTWMGMDAFKGEYRAAMKKSEVMATFKDLEGKLENLKDDKAEKAWIAERATLSHGRATVARAYSDAMDVLASAQEGKDNPGIWFISLDVEPSGNGNGEQPAVKLLGVMENTNEKMLKDLGEKPEKEAYAKAYGEMKRLCEVDVKGLLIDPLAQRGCVSTDPDKSLQRKGTFVKDLGIDVHKGTSYYRFVVEWTYKGEE
ncbi:MAG: type IV pilus assembly protein PilM [Planctomycetota bacterium]|jgi:type IV pilus assembly protein PilM